MNNIGGQLLVEIQTNHGADDVTLVLEISVDLSAWSTAPEASFTISRSNNGDGTTTLSYLSTPGFLTDEVRRFLRLRAELIE